MAELKRIDFNAGSFEANGETYYIEGGFTIARYAEFQILEKEMGYGLTFKSMYEKHEKLYQLVNKQKFADAAVLLNDVMRGIAKLNEREPTILKVCALSINTAGEDRTTITQDLINKKIADWKKEGIDMRDFFSVASSLINGFSEIYRTIAQDILDQEK